MATTGTLRGAGERAPGAARVPPLPFVWRRDAATQELTWRAWVELSEGQRQRAASRRALPTLAVHFAQRCVISPVPGRRADEVRRPTGIGQLVSEYADCRLSSIMQNAVVGQDSAGGNPSL